MFLACGTKLTAAQGIGQWWLFKAQPCLSRIDDIEGRSSSSSGSSRRTLINQSEDERRRRPFSLDMETRLSSQDYVEARGILVPAVHYLDRAVQLAEDQGILDGLLLTSARDLLPDTCQKIR